MWPNATKWGSLFATHSDLKWLLCDIKVTNNAMYDVIQITSQRFELSKIVNLCVLLYHYANREGGKS